MSLKCRNPSCQCEIARIDQLAFRQDALNGGLILTFRSTEFSYTENRLPSSISVRENPSKHRLLEVFCKNKSCYKKLGTLNAISGFEDLSVNFSAKYVNLYASRYDRTPINTTQKAKWSDISMRLPQISRVTSARISSNKSQLVGQNTVHFHNTSDDLKQMIDAGLAVSQKSNLTPRTSQWRSFFFAGLNNTLLVLPTGLGKTLISELLIKAYRDLNPRQFIIFIVPNKVLVDQQANDIEKNTGLKCHRRSGEHDSFPWNPEFIGVCTPAMVVQAINFNEILMSQICLLVLDEAHEAINSNSMYGEVASKLDSATALQRPRVLGMTASPSGTNKTNIIKIVESLCKKLSALPYSPDRHSDELGQEVKCKYIENAVTPFEAAFEKLVFTIIQMISKCDPFFETNIQKLQENESATMKIDKIVKNISDAHHYSLHKNDIRLLQLCALMKKWIDSLDLLRVFGPKRTLEDIEKDLNFMNKNENFNTIAALCQKALNYASTELSHIRHISRIDQESSRVSNLLSELKHYKNDNTRILIFVNRRFTAERLCRSLTDNEVTRDMNPQYIIGNTAGDYPRELQQEVLKKFRQGDIRLLVATSVLEQGLDVASCGVVVCFDGIKSLKSIIQSRGRARQNFANFIVFVSPDKRYNVSDLVDLESTMNYAVKSLMITFKSKFESTMETEIQKFLTRNLEWKNEQQGGSPSAIDQDSDSDISDFDEDDAALTLTFFKYNNQNGLRKILCTIKQQMPEKVKICQKQMKHITAKFNLEEPSTANSHPKSLLSEVLKSLSSYAAQNKVSSWIEMSSYLELTPNVSHLRYTVDFDQISSFLFEDPFTVTTYGHPIWTGETSLIIQTNCIRISFNNSHQFVLDSFNIAAVVFNESHQFSEIFLCLRKPPRYFVDGTLYPFDFTSTTFNLSLKRLSPFHSMDDLRKILSDQIMEVYHIVNFTYKEKRECRSTGTKIEDFQKFCLINEWHSAHASLLPPILPDELVKSLLTIPSNKLLELVLLNTEPVPFETIKLPNNMKQLFPKNCKDDIIPQLSSNYFQVATVRITPSRIMFTPMTMIPQNRVFRYFPNCENFVLVDFASEYDDENPWKSDKIVEHFRMIMINGFKIAGRTYKFLGCSNSQLREGRCWFSCLDRQDVYSKIGDLSHINNPGRKLTRLALAFSSSRETIEVNHAKYLRKVEADITTGNVKFSDGIGKGSIEIFKEISKMLNLNSVPSAFQIRVGGIKGVISRYHQECDLTIRESMKKFESEHNKIEVLNVSYSIPLYLNRHVILMLSAFGVSNETFLEMQQSDLNNYLTILTSTNFAETLDFVKSRSRIVNWDRFASRITSEPFFQQILMYQVIDLVSDLANHAKISVDKGRVLMGVLDETDTLNYGEIFAYVVEDNIDLVMNGDVIVFRNPCVLPSDIRRLRARRDVPENFKMLYKNVVVFPAKGPACHAHECAGGDLDGDLYYVIWDERLIPKYLLSPGREIIEVNTRELEANVQSGQANIDIDMLSFYCNYQQQNRLGIIANAHLATSDQFGIESDEAITIARYVVAETDAPKKGFTVGMDYANLIPDKYPHYMRKVDKGSYYSDTIVGVLFDEALSVLDIVSARYTQGPPKKHIAAATTTDEASVDYWYSLYCCDIQRLLKTFSLSSEADLFSGCPIWQKDFRSDFKKRTRVKETLDDTMKMFWAKWSETFDKFRTRINDDQAKIFQWYNRPKSELWPASSFSFLALPYVTSNVKEKQTLVASVQQSTNYWMSFNKLNWIDDWNRRKGVGETIFKYLNPIDCDFYGSSMLGLSEDFSDIVLFTSGDLEVVASKLCILDTNARKYDGTHTFVRVMFDSYSAEITNFCEPPCGSVKTYSIAKCFDENPSLWPALRILLEWARMNKIVKSGGSQGSIMTVVGFVLLFIELSLGQQLKISGSMQPYNFSRLRGWMEAHTDGEKSANLILNFLQMLEDRKNFEFISSRKDAMNNENLVRPELLEDLRKNAEFACFILATHNGDIRKLFQYSTKYRMLKINNKFKKPSEASRDFENQLMKDILKKSGLKKSLSVNLKLVVKGNSYYLEITGNDHREFLKIENALKLIQEKSFSIRKYRRGDRCYHIKNSTIIIPEFSNGPYTELTFSIFQGENYHPQHSHCVRAVLDIRVETLNNQWMTTEYKRYESKFVTQIEEYKKSRSQLHKFRGTDKWRLYGEMRCVIRVGDQYFFNVQDSLINSFESLRLQRIECMIANVEICHEIEKANLVCKDVRQNRSLSIFVVPSKESRLKNVSEELNLVPLQQVKNVHIENKKRRATEASEQLSMNRSKKVGGLRHTFHTITATTKGNVQLFANRNGFRCCGAVADNRKKHIRVNIAAIWRSREISIATNECGIVKSIHHRKVRWMSATFKRFKKSNSDDVRSYLEAKHELDEDENCLNTLKQYLDNRSIFTTDFVKQIGQTEMSADIDFPSNPLIPEILHLNWQFYVMRINKVDAAYKNQKGDVLEFNEIYDGVFDSQGTFEWFEKHNELEIEMNTEQRSNETLCRESYEMSLKLFDFVK